MLRQSNQKTQSALESNSASVFKWKTPHLSENDPNSGNIPSNQRKKDEQFAKLVAELQSVKLLHKKQKEQSEKTIEALTLKVADSEKDNNLQTEQLNASQIKVVQLNKELQVTKMQLQTSKMELSETRQYSASQEMKSRHILAESQQECERLSEEVSKQSHRVESMQKSSQAEKLEIESLKGKLSAMEAKCDSLQSQLAEREIEWERWRGSVVTKMTQDSQEKQFIKESQQALLQGLQRRVVNMMHVF